MRLPFFLRRPWLIVRGTFTNRDRPDLEALGAITDPEEFVWAVLPHAARSFATSILVLPEAEAWAAAIAYLQCRILDTYEDLYPDEATRPAVLRTVGSHWLEGARAPLEPIPATVAVTERDRVHLLLVERAALIDEAYAALDAAARASIDELVANMANGMAWASETFSRQHGVLESQPQRARYCHYVIGEPALYAIRSLLHLPQTDERRADAIRVAEMIQLANITRDIERDLVRGIAYHPELRADLGMAEPLPAATRTRVRAVRETLLREALAGVDAYARLVADLPAGISQARGAAVLMLAFTSRYYSKCAAQVGLAGWGRPPRIAIYANAVLGTLSARWTDRVIRRITADFHRFLATPTTSALPSG
jgi:phytoene/squalene synthetase